MSDDQTRPRDGVEGRPPGLDLPGPPGLESFDEESMVDRNPGSKWKRHVMSEQRGGP